MNAPHRNKTNPCARVLAEMTKTCFLICQETDFDANITWAGHVNELQIYVTPKGASIDHSVLEFNEYLNIPKSEWSSLEFRTDTYPKVKAFAKTLTAFYETHID